MPIYSILFLLILCRCTVCCLSLVHLHFQHSYTRLAISLQAARYFGPFSDFRVCFQYSPYTSLTEDGVRTSVVIFSLYFLPTSPFLFLGLPLIGIFFNRCDHTLDYGRPYLYRLLLFLVNFDIYSHLPCNSFLSAYPRNCIMIIEVFSYPVVLIVVVALCGSIAQTTR